MLDVYKKALPYIEKRMCVPLFPDMASHITLLATGVLPVAAPLGLRYGRAVFLRFGMNPSTYVENLVMLDMGYKEEASKRIQRTIDRTIQHDPEMKLYNLHGK